MVVVGGGQLDLSLGVWSRLGAEVTIVEFLPEICPQLDADVSKVARRILEKHGLNFSLSTKVSGCKTGKNGVVLTVEKERIYKN